MHKKKQRYGKKWGGMEAIGELIYDTFYPPVSYEQWVDTQRQRRTKRAKQKFNASRQKSERLSKQLQRLQDQSAKQYLDEMKAIQDYGRFEIVPREEIETESMRQEEKLSKKLQVDRKIREEDPEWVTFGGTLRRRKHPRLKSRRAHHKRFI